MNILKKFSYKLFGIMTALFCYTDFSYATTTICSNGYYLSRCGKTTIGTNWLKGMQGTSTTPDYYSYGLSDSDTTNITNLRKFFAGLEPISYQTKNEVKRTVMPNGDDGYKKARDTILSKFCLINNSRLAEIECKRCPGNAEELSESTVDGDSSIGFSWQIHTIADCYMKNFSDHTGAYIYAPATATTSSNSAKKCYYSNNIEGDILILE